MPIPKFNEIKAPVLEYFADGNHPVMAFGYMILKLDEVPNAMNGKVVAFGALSQRIIVSKVELTKNP